MCAVPLKLSYYYTPRVELQLNDLILHAKKNFIIIIILFIFLQIFFFFFKTRDYSLQQIVKSDFLNIIIIIIREPLVM